MRIEFSLTSCLNGRIYSHEMCIPGPRSSAPIGCVAIGSDSCRRPTCDGISRLERFFIGNRIFVTGWVVEIPVWHCLYQFFVFGQLPRLLQHTLMSTRPIAIPMVWFLAKLQFIKVHHDNLLLDRHSPLEVQSLAFD